jgi:hypothetical protein
MSMSKTETDATVRYVMGTKHNPKGEEGTEEEVVWVRPPHQPQPKKNACDWCGQPFDTENDGDMRRVDGLTENLDGEWVYTGDEFHGECNHERSTATMAALEE